MAATFEKTWAFDLNRAYSPASALDLTRYTMWVLAAQLTGNIGGLTLGLWTLYASSDSVTAGTDSTDRWVLAGPYDGTKIVRGASTAVHSWIVLRSPTMNGSNWYLILSFNTSADTSIRYGYSKTAPTGGSTTVTPTSSADGWWPTTTNAGSSKTAADWAINAGTQDNSRFNLGLTSGGDFYFIGCKQGAGVANLLMTFHALSNYATTGTPDVYPVWAAGHYLATGVSGSQLFDNGATQRTVGFITNAGAAGAAQPLIGFGYYTNGSWIYCSSTSMVLNPLNATAVDFPVWVWGGAAGGSTHVRGRVADLAYCFNHINAVPEGSVSPSSGTPDSVRIGWVWWPTNAAFTL